MDMDALLSMAWLGVWFWRHELRPGHGGTFGSENISIDKGVCLVLVVQG